MCALSRGSPRETRAKSNRRLPRLRKIIQREYTMPPVLELTFCDIAGSPWEGRATVRFQNEPGDPFPVREGLTGKEREEIRWYIEDHMDLPEGSNERRSPRPSPRPARTTTFWRPSTSATLGYPPTSAPWPSRPKRSRSCSIRPGLRPQRRFSDTVARKLGYVISATTLV